VKFVTVLKSIFGLYRTDVGASAQLGALENKLHTDGIRAYLPYVPGNRIEATDGKLFLVTELNAIEAVLLTQVVVLLLSDPVLAETPNLIVFIVGLLALLLPRAIGHTRHQQALKKLM